MQGKMSGSEKEREHVRHFLQKKNVTKKFQEVFLVVVVQNNGKEMYKKCAARAKLFFCLLDLLLFFSPFSLPSSVNVMLHETIRNNDF